MKKLNVMLMIAVSAFVVSCEKEPIQQVQQKSTVGAQKVNYNESNSKAVEWNQLPEELKNAPNLSSDQNTANKIDATYLTSIGPWGGGGGSAFSIYPTASTDKIYAIAVRSGAFVDALSVWYIRTNGTLYSYSVGGTGGTFYLQMISSTERIHAIAGRSGLYLDRLAVYTNYKSFSYGGNGGSPFYAGTSYSQILGFYGGAGRFVDRIGAYVYSY